MNQVILTARIAEHTALRYTPAGLPALDLMLEHASEIRQADQPRQVSLLLKALALGTLAERLAVQPLGSSWRFDGFLAGAKGGRNPVLHIQEFQQVSI